MNSISLLRISKPAILACIGFLMITYGAFAQGANVQDTIAYVLKHHKKPDQQCDALYKLGNYYWNIGNMEAAQTVMMQSKTVAENNNYHKGIYDAFAVLGAISLRNGDAATALAISKECMQLARENNNEYGENRANYLLVIMAQVQGNIDSVIAISERSLKGPHVIYDSTNLPKFNIMLADAYLSKGNLHQANAQYLEALRISEKTNNTQMQVICFGNLASINFDLKNLEQALKFYRLSLAFSRKSGQLQEEARSYHGIANIYKNLGMQDSTIFYFKKALVIVQQLGYPVDIAEVKTNLGGYLVFLNQPDSGIHYLVSAKHDFIRANDSINIAENALALGDAYWRMGHDSKNRIHLNNALNEVMLSNTIAEIKKADELRLRSYYFLSGIHDDLGNESQAFHYLKKYTLINDTIRTKAYTQQIAEMQTKYDLEKKEIEISKLNAENQLGTEKITRQRLMNLSLLAIAGLILVSGSVTYRNVQKKRVAEKQVALLERQNAIESMRSKIASDVHDEMGANLTRLGLNAQQLLQSSAVPPNEKLLAEKMSNQSKEIITGMREIIWASNPANDNLRSMLGFMRQYIDRFFDGTQIRPVVNFPHDIGEVTLHPEVRRNLFLILKESLNNAIKYSGSERIDIEFHSDNENFLFSVKDYGKGLDQKNQDDFSHGLHNMQMRAAQIQSFFRLISSPGQGVQISVEGKLY